jgi:hypothetical protein
LNTNAVISIALCAVVPLSVTAVVLRAPRAELWFAPAVVACLLCPLAAAFFGHAANRELRGNGAAGSGRSAMATAGLTIGYLELALLGFITLGSIHHPSRRVAFEANAVSSLRTLNFAAHAYAKAHPQVGFPNSLQDLDSQSLQPGQDWQIDPVLASGTKLHYRFTYVPKNHGGAVDAYQIFADPLDAKDRDARHFFTDQSASIRRSQGAPANESSEPL